MSACTLVVVTFWMITGSGVQAGRAATLVLSGNETKIDLTTGGPRRLDSGQPDSVSVLDFAKFPPTVTHLMDIPNSVIGPPSNIAITPDHRLALIANSIRLDPVNATNWVPESFVHVLDLRASPPRVVGRVQTGLQPSGLSISDDGNRALVADRAAGTVTVLGLDRQGTEVRRLASIPVCLPAESLSDVAIAPGGRLAVASVQKGSYLAILKLTKDGGSFTGQKVSTYGQPYRVVITPDGELALTAGQGFGNRLDRDALTVVSLKSDPICATDYIALGAVPESIELSPDGKLLVAVVMNGSNLGLGSPDRRSFGLMVVLVRKGATYRVAEEHRIGPIPEGVAFTGDGKYLVVQCHAERNLWVYKVRGQHLADTGLRIAVPGFPSALRAAP